MKPGAGFFTAALFWLFLGGAAFFSETLSLAWLLFGFCLLPFIIMDGLVLLLLTDFLKAERSVAGALALGEKSVVKLTIRRSFTRPFLARSIRLFDIYPDSFDCRIFPVKLARAALDAPRDSSPAAVFEYPIVPLERGPWEF